MLEAIRRGLDTTTEWAAFGVVLTLITIPGVVAAGLALFLAVKVVKLIWVL